MNRITFVGLLGKLYQYCKRHNDEMIRLSFYDDGSGCLIKMNGTKIDGTEFFGEKELLAVLEKEE